MVTLAAWKNSPYYCRESQRVDECCGKLNSLPTQGMECPRLIIRGLHSRCMQCHIVVQWAMWRWDGVSCYRRGLIRTSIKLMRGKAIPVHSVKAHDAVFLWQLKAMFCIRFMVVNMGQESYTGCCLLQEWGRRRGWSTSGRVRWSSWPWTRCRRYVCPAGVV